MEMNNIFNAESLKIMFWDLSFSQVWLWRLKSTWVTPSCA